MEKAGVISHNQNGLGQGQLRILLKVNQNEESRKAQIEVAEGRSD